LYSICAHTLGSRPAEELDAVTFWPRLPEARPDGWCGRRPGSVKIAKNLRKSGEIVIREDLARGLRLKDHDPKFRKSALKIGGIAVIREAFSPSVK
jgi:hypothetical protein